MLSLFAAADPQTTLASGNIVAIEALIIVVLAGVVAYITKKLFDNQRDSAAEIKSLNQARIDDGKAHTADYKEMAKNDQTVLLGNAQASELLAGKIEAVKGRN